MTTSLTGSDADLDRAIVAEIRGAVAATWRAGRLLAERKRRLQHGQWGAYLDTIGLPARTAQKAMAIATKYAQPAHLPGTIEGALEAGPVERRRAAVLRFWPGLVPKMADPDTRTVVDHYTKLTAFLEGGDLALSQEQFRWVVGVEHLLDAQFAA